MDIELQLENGVLNDKNRYSYYLCFLYYLYVCNGRVCMNEKEKQQIENLEEQIGILFKVVDKLEKRIATLEKVLASHAKCIGEMREDKHE